MNKKLRLWLKRLLYITGLLLLIFLLEWQGLYAFLIIVLCITLLKLWARRELFMTNLKLLESTVWGKPLDKDCWEKEEMKNTKVKIVWRKKKKNESKSTD